MESGLDFLFGGLPNAVSSLDLFIFTDEVLVNLTTVLVQVILKIAHIIIIYIFSNYLGYAVSWNDARNRLRNAIPSGNELCSS